VKISFKIDGGIKVTHKKQKLEQYMNTKPPLQMILKGILHTNTKTTYPQKKGTYETSCDEQMSTQRAALILATHTQILKQQKQLNGRNHHIPLHVSTEG
jgi:hypothetical protein